MKQFISINKLNVRYVKKCCLCNGAFDDVKEGDSRCPKCKTLSLIVDDVLVQVPRVICFVEGGVVHDVMADQSAQLRIIDYDTEGSGNIQTIHLVEAENQLCDETQECHIGKWDLERIEDLDPFFNQEAIQ